MPKKSLRPKSVRNAISQLHLLLNNSTFIRGTPTFLRNTCGKPNCKCTRGEKHLSLYIRQSLNGKLKTVLVPHSRWDDVQLMAQNYKKIIELLEIVSAFEWNHLKDKA